ncbi:hypothetical protein Tco_1062308 [Tanacetum coccineum]
MPRATVGNMSLTRSYIPKVSQTPGISPSIARFYKPIEDRCIHEAKQQYNLAYLFVKRIESARATPKAHLPYGMFLTRLFLHVMELYPNLDNGIYDVVERVMRPLALRQTRLPRSDRGKVCHSVSSTSAIITVDLHLTKEMMMRMMVLLVLVPPSPTTYLNSLGPLDYQPYDFPLLLNKMMIFSSNVKPTCLIKHNKCIRNLEVDSSHLARHYEESSARKRSEDVV